MSRTHEFEAMRPREFRAEFERVPVIYCPFGGVEYHGTHQSLAIDFTKGHAICLRTAAIAGGIVHPTIPIVPAGKPPFLATAELRLKKTAFYHAYPSVFGGRELCESIARELFGFFAECLGFKLCVAFGAHGPASNLLKQIARDCGERVGMMRLLAVGSGDFIKDELLRAKEQYGLKSSGAHGGMWETAMNMALDPQGVDLPALDQPFDGFYEMPADVTAGNRQATAEFGEFLMNTYAERLAVEVRKILSA